MTHEDLAQAFDALAELAKRVRLLEEHANRRLVVEHELETRLVALEEKLKTLEARTTTAILMTEHQDGQIKALEARTFD